MSYDICREDGDSICWLGLDECRKSGCYNKRKQETEGVKSEEGNMIKPLGKLTLGSYKQRGRYKQSASSRKK